MSTPSGKRICAYVGNFRVPHSTETHVARALESLGHEVIRVQEDECDWPWIPIHAMQRGVDFVMWTHTHQYGPEPMHGDQTVMLERLREVGIPSVGFHLDRWFGLNREHQVYEEPYFRQDIVVTADGGHEAEFAKAGVNHVWMPPAVDHTEAEVVVNASRQYRSMLVFVGSFNYPHPEWEPTRTAMMTFLRQTYGGKFRTWPRGKSIRGLDLNILYTSAQMVVGDSCLAGNAHHYWSDRIPETIGRGGFLIHPEVEGLEEEGFVDGRTIVTFPVGDHAALRERIQYYAAHPTERLMIKDAGRALVLERHTYAARMRSLIALVDEWKEGRRAHTAAPPDPPQRVDDMVAAPVRPAKAAAAKKAPAKKTSAKKAVKPS